MSTSRRRSSQRQSCSFRCSSSARRFPRPVTWSVSASARLVSISRRWSRTVSASRTTTAKSAAEASASVTPLDSVEVVVDEHADGEPRAGGRDGDAAPALLARERLLRRLPGGVGEQEAAEWPADVHQAELVVGARVDLVEVDAVGDGEDRDAGGGQRPAPRDPPAGKADGRHDEREQDRVADRVGEVDGDRDGIAVRRVQDRVEDERGGERGDGEPGDDAVRPDVHGDAWEPRPEHQRHARVREHVEGEPEPVGDRRGCALIRQEERPVRVAEAPRPRSRRPGAASPSARGRAAARARRRRCPSR